MKKLSLILHIVLFAGLAALYLLYFTGWGRGTDDSGTYENDTGGASIPVGIAFVNFDSLMLNYDMYHDLRDKLAAKQKTSEAELTAEGRQFEKEAADFQDKVQKGLVTRSRAQEMEQQLMAEQQRLLQLKDNLSLELMEEEQVMNRQLLFSIMDYIKEYNRKHNYHYILSHTLGGALLFANDSLDITDEVLRGLNKKYTQVREK